jgi:hypothetical protein
MSKLLGGDMGKMMSEMMNGDISAPEKAMESIMEKIGIPDTSANPTIVTNILDDIKGNLKESGKDMNALLENTKKLGQKYQDKIQSGELKMEDMMGSLMGVLKNPNQLMETMKDFNLSDLPDPTDMLGTLMGGSVDINNIMSSVMGKNKMRDPSDNIPLTEEQLKELEDFYSSLHI